MNNYARFAAMIATSTVVMFGLMYLNTYALDHAHFSETRVYMACMMGASMAVIMLLYMLGMYKNRTANIGIALAAVAVFALSLWLVRSQKTVQDLSWMRAMIPHHSIAILTSERANITDPRVRKLADDIIMSQRREIDEMKELISDIEVSGVAVIPQVPEPEAGAVQVPEGYQAEVFLKNLTYPTSASDVFGKGKVFLPFFGHMSPMTGEVGEHGGHRVLRIDPATKKSELFFSKQEHGHGGGQHGPSGSEKHSKLSGEGQHQVEKSQHVSAGPRRLMDVVFSKEGDALYIVDFGSMIVKTAAMPIRNSGVVRRVSLKESNLTNQPRGNLSVPAVGKGLPVQKGTTIK